MNLNEEGCMRCMKQELGYRKNHLNICCETEQNQRDNLRRDGRSQVLSHTYYDIFDHLLGNI
jgi:hypothetical protein